MEEKPHPTLLKREEPAAQIALHFAKHVAVLRDLANYGSNLIIRSYDSSDKKMADAVVCLTLLSKVVAMVDSVQVQISAGCCHTAVLPSRAALEASFYIDFILAKDSEKRATRYLVANYRRQRLWAQRVIPGTKQYEAYKAIPQGMGVDLYANNPTIVSEAQAHLDDISKILA